MQKIEEETHGGGRLQGKGDTIVLGKIELGGGKKKMLSFLLNLFIGQCTNYVGSWVPQARRCPPPSMSGGWGTFNRRDRSWQQ